MSVRGILPYVAILLVGQAVLDAGPAIVAEREGGMGLGSALVAALVIQVAGIVVGAALAGYVVDRRSVAAAALFGAFLYYVGLMATGLAPMGSLATVVAGMGTAGVGFGAMSTAAFSAAAAIEAPRARVTSIVLLLAAPTAARIVVGTAFAAGPPAFIVGGAAIVGLALAAVHRFGRMPERVISPSAAPERVGRSVGLAALAVPALGVGAILALAGADPSRLSASLIAGTLGMGGFETVDVARAVLFGAGMALLMLGGAALLAATGRVVRVAVPAVLLVGFAGSGVAAALTRAMTAGRIPDGTWALIGVATVGGGGLGLVIGGMLIARGREARVPAVFGSVVLTLVCALCWVMLQGSRPEPGDVMPIVLIAIGGLGAGLAASALRLALTDVQVYERGRAAGAGAVAAVMGSALGGFIGAGEAMITLGEPQGVTIGLVSFVIAAAAVSIVAPALPRVSHPASRGNADWDSVSRTSQ